MLTFERHFAELVRISSARYRLVSIVSSFDNALIEGVKRRLLPAQFRLTANEPQCFKLMTVYFEIYSILFNCCFCPCRFS